MDISKNIAQKIVHNLKDIINQDLNFIDKNGYIIASTDSSRVNTFHQASVDCIKLNKTIVIGYDGQYFGSKKGINLPVQIHDEIIGVIGISGDLSEVEQFGEIIKKMTEILLLENWIKENKTKQRELDRILLESVITNTNENINYMDLNSNRDNKYLCVSNLLSDATNNQILDPILNILDNKIYNKSIKYAIIYNKLIILFIDVDIQYIKYILDNLKKRLDPLYNMNIKFGVSSVFYDLSLGNKNYEQACNSLNWIIQIDNKKNIEFYDDMDLGILLADNSQKNIEYFSNKVLKNLDDKDFKFYDQLIEIYSNKNGSIKKVSEELYMHKNSIQYRLDKLHQLTGYNPRDLNDFIVLRLAFLLKN